MSSMSRAWVGMATICLAALAGGCGEGPFHVEVSLDKTLQDQIGPTQSLEVDMIGVNDTELPTWTQMSVNAYWEPENPIRTGSPKFVMTFGAGTKGAAQMLKKDNPIWKTWIDQRKATNLVVLAYLPTWNQKESPGAADARRVVLPLEITRWEKYLWGNDTIKIVLGSAGLTPLRQPKAK